MASVPPRSAVGWPYSPGNRTGDNAAPVARGLARTARVITAAAAIMVVVFLSFVLGADVSVKQIGLGLAVAVLIDATVVRMVLVPAVMELLGRANWWLPAPLARILPAALQRRRQASLSDRRNMLVGMSRKPRRTQGQAWTPDHAGDTVDGITWGQVELEPEASHWLEGLDDQRWAQALFHLDLLRERARRAAGRALHPAAKTRMHESAEISRAARAMDRCLREGHMPDEDEYKEGSR